jgi:hypothetical protein
MQQLHVSSFDATALAYAGRGFDPHFLLNLAGTQQSWSFYVELLWGEYC